MGHLTDVRKLQPQTAIRAGVSTSHPVLGFADGAEVLVGIAEFAPGELHFDQAYDECIFVVEGEIEIEDDGRTHRAGAGEFLWIPKARSLVYRAASACRFVWVIPRSSLPSPDQPRESAAAST